MQRKRPPLSQLALKVDFLQEDIWPFFFFFVNQRQKGLKKKLLITVRISFNQTTVWVHFFSSDELT